MEFWNSVKSKAAFSGEKIKIFFASLTSTAAGNAHDLTPLKRDR